MFTLNAQEETIAVENPIDQEEVILEQETDFIINDIVTLDNENALEADEATGSSTLWLFVRMIFALIIVVALIYGVTFLLKKGLVSKESENPFLKRAATLTLAPGKTVQVVTLIDKAWVVGVSDAGINLIGELTDKDLIDQMVLEAEKEPLSKARDFSSILSSFTNTAKLTETALKKQRERLKKGPFNE